mmetsp:Transcript_10782/g.16960  ORF Transcript_10782/g.16960 Transcript_10782/m.16960 type:complete len:452 (-) Transcript_10782:155-1510(-)|eukprot:CAMPEP_0117023990 /NCGR_PEP_ID=MMETSP0472-20121206/17861_1 /TAXON_ID=693140 ORGANISM="Tiarina fusus, Strain LIS" /NCGR_SAMPLE_ID=MMETSP0472 /ASSEMBLY_ACC=CAM_ASM_000603 /LENGTH=451 /DNA_ID=CAMNT_0004730293 /DNA_START=176 /DNA_END=1531 /DNA_ORIENTATION=-
MGEEETALQTPDVWSRDRLMGKSVSFKGIPAETEETNGSDGKTLSPRQRRKSKVKVDVKIDPMLWGQPGHLTDEEADVYFKFKAEIAERDADFRDTIFSFGEGEGEVWALCRWLRARKFVYEDVIKMVEEATVCRATAKQHNFYPDPKQALGCDISHYVHQYPQCYSGVAKNGAPIFISRPGILDVDAVECLTTLDGILKFHWFVMMCDFGDKLRAQKEKDAHFKRFECFCVLDLENLTMGQLSSRSLAIIKEQSAIDALCFPETMNKMFIINGPRFFGATWKLIKGWLDPRTASKIEVISDKKKWQEKILELVREDQLPADYGGKGPNTRDSAKEQYIGSMKGLHTEVMYLRGHGSVTYEVAEGDEVAIEVYTKSTSGAKFTVCDAYHKAPDWVTAFEVKHKGDDDATTIPTKETITQQKIKGPASIKVKADSNGGRWTTYNFLVAFLTY